MPKTKQALKLQKRDWVTLVLVIVIVIMGWTLYQHKLELNAIGEGFIKDWVQNRYEINSLKTCIDQNISPCNITQPRQ